MLVDRREQLLDRRELAVDLGAQRSRIVGVARRIQKPFRHFRELIAELLEPFFASALGHFDE